MASLGGGYKPLVRITTKMDVSMAMAILDFPPSQAFEHLDLIDVEKRFMFKIHQVQLEAHGTEMLSKKKTKSRAKEHQRVVIFKQKSDARKLNEAFQFLIQKRRRLTGRAMTTNWQTVAGKSTSASNVTKLLSAMKGANMTSAIDEELPSEDAPPVPSDTDTSKLGALNIFSLKPKETVPKETEATDETKDMSREEKELFRQQQSELARQLAQEAISSRRIKSFDEIFSECNASTESNYWLQFSFMSMENRDYFIMRHGKHPDEMFRSRLKRLKKESNRISITLPPRLEKLHQDSLERLRNKKNFRNKRQKRSSNSRSPKKVPSSIEVTYYDHNLPNERDDQFEDLDDPLNLKEKSLYLNDGVMKENENIRLEDSNAYNLEEGEQEDCDNHQEYGKYEDVNKKDDSFLQDNASENLNNKLSVLRRKLSHLNMKPNLS